MMTTPSIDVDFQMTAAPVADPSMPTPSVAPSEVVVAQFQSVMEKPLAENAALFEALKSIVSTMTDQVPQAPVTDAPADAAVATRPAVVPVVCRDVRDTASIVKDSPLTAPAPAAVSVPEAAPAPVAVSVPEATPAPVAAFVPEATPAPVAEVDPVAAPVSASVDVSVDVPVDVPVGAPVVRETADIAVMPEVATVEHRSDFVPASVVEKEIVVSAPIPDPISGPIPTPIPDPFSDPIPAPIPDPFSVPITVPDSVPLSDQVSASVPRPDSASVPRPDSVSVAQPMPVSVSVPADVTAPAPVEASVVREVVKGVDVVGVVDDETVTSEALVAAGVAPAVQPVVVPVQVEPLVSVQSVDVAARVEQVSKAEVLVQAAEAVADTILVSPGLLRGQGEVRIQLRPDVLEGTEIRIAVTGRQMEVNFMPQTQDMAVLIEQCRPQLEQHLAEKIHSFQIAVDVRRRSTGKGRV